MRRPRRKLSGASLQGRPEFVRKRVMNTSFARACGGLASVVLALAACDGGAPKKSAHVSQSASASERRAVPLAETIWPTTVFEHEVTEIITQFLAGRPLEGPVVPEPNPPGGR